MLFFLTVVLEKTLESPSDCKEIKPVNPKSVLNILWKDWCWSYDPLATWYEKATHWKRPWCWERLKAKGEGDNRGWDVWMASLTQWTWVWASSGRWWRTGKPRVLQSMGLQRVGHNWATERQMSFNCCLSYPSALISKPNLYKETIQFATWSLDTKTAIISSATFEVLSFWDWTIHLGYNLN